MRLPLFWRMVAPSLTVSLLLLTVGFAAATYVYVWNSRVATDLDRRLGAALVANEFVLSLRDVRAALDQYSAFQDPRFLERARTQAKEASAQLEQVSRLSDSLEEDRSDHTRQRISELLRRLDHFSEASDDGIQSIRDYVHGEVLEAAHALVDHCRQAVADMNQQNQYVAGLVGTSLAVLGLCGAVAGLLAGYSVARSVALSIEQLGGSVRTLAQTLDDETIRDDLQVTGLHELTAAMSKISDRTVGVVSELEQSRDSAVRSDQLAAVGQLAAGIAHELRNPLAAVKLLIDAAAEENRPLSNEDILVTQEELSRMDRLFASFLDFARPPTLRRKQVDPQELVSKAVDLVRPRAKVQDVAIDLRAHSPMPVDADPQQIRQVILNVLLNALDAQPGGGSIVVDVSSDSWADGPACVVRISDDGPGIAPAVAGRLFEPFVSTKDTGVGLGLAVCRRILLMHGGGIEATTLPDGGAQFSIYLPNRPEISAASAAQ